MTSRTGRRSRHRRHKAQTAAWKAISADREIHYRAERVAFFGLHDTAPATLAADALRSLREAFAVPKGDPVVAVLRWLERAQRNPNAGTLAEAERRLRAALHGRTIAGDVRA
jgi:hypothetical protein